jgi:multisubunit Na+/H+ antiporter MnhG subunit
MTDLLLDISIWVLLLVAIGFGGIGLMGLMIFPDTRSRMYTAIRASVIGVGALVLALVVVNLSLFLSTGTNPYGTHILHAGLLLFILVGGNWFMYRMIRGLTKPENFCRMESGQKAEADTKK